MPKGSHFSALSLLLSCLYLLMLIGYSCTMARNEKVLRSLHEEQRKIAITPNDICGLTSCLCNLRIGVLYRQDYPVGLLFIINPPTFYSSKKIHKSAYTTRKGKKDWDDTCSYHWSKEGLGCLETKECAKCGTIKKCDTRTTRLVVGLAEATKSDSLVSHVFWMRRSDLDPWTTCVH